MDWQTYGPHKLRFLKWSTTNRKVPSYGGWIIIRDLPLHLWIDEVVPYIGDQCGGFVKISKKSSRLMDLMELEIKVKVNCSGFIPATIELPPSITKEAPLSIHIDPFFMAKNLVGNQRRQRDPQKQHMHVMEHAGITVTSLESIIGDENRPQMAVLKLAEKSIPNIEPITGDEIRP